MSRAPKIGFVMEQALGHITHTKNLQAFFAGRADIDARWALVDFAATGWAARVPLYKSNWTVRAGLRARHELTKLDRGGRPDVLFFHTQVPAILAQDWIRRVPSVVSLDATPLQYDELGAFYQHAKGPEWLEGLKWRLNQSCYAAARRIVVWAEWTKRGLIDGYGVDADRVSVLPPGVLIENWLRPQPRVLSEAAPKILFVGGDLERKGGGLLLEAFRALRTPGMELHLVTKTAVQPEPGLFVYRNMQPNSRELVDLYHRCDIFVLPTFGDCLPMVLSEAGAAGLATISTRVAGIPEIIRHGETGFTVTPGDLPALVDALKTLVDNPQLRLDMGARAIAHVSRHYDAGRNADTLLRMLKGAAQPAA